MRKKKFQLVADEYFNLQVKLRESCLRYLKSTLKKNGGRIDFDRDEDDVISVPYDGGNNPLDASNLYSIVNSVYFNKHGEIVLDIEDDSEYYLDSVETNYLYDLCDLIDNLSRLN